MKAKIYLILGFSLLILCLIALVAGVAAQAAPPPFAQGTPKPLTIARAPWTPTPTRTSAPWPGFDFRDLVNYWGAGGDGDYCHGFSDPQPKMPAVTYIQARDIQTKDVICLYGFPTYAKVTVKIYDPSKRLMATIPKVIVGELSSTPINAIDFGPLPNNAKSGKWTIRAEAPGLLAENWFAHPFNDDNMTRTRAISLKTSPYDPRRLGGFKVGDTLLAQGAGFKPNEEVPVAVYHFNSKEWQGKFVSGQLARADKYGRFEAGFKITSEFIPGTYFLQVVYDQNQDGFSISDKPVRFVVTLPKTVCSGAAPTLLSVGDTAMVSAGLPNNVREKPGLSRRKLGQLQEFETLEILAGPKCADGMVWWKVRSENTGMDGWTAEGNRSDTWLIGITR